MSGTRSRCAAAVGAAGLLLAACTSPATEVTASPGASASASTSGGATSTSPPSSAPDTATPTTEASTTTPPSAPASPSGPPSDAPVTEPADLPTQAANVQGATVAGLYLAVEGTFDATAVTDAQAAADDLGYQAGVGELGCDRGAAEGLGLDPDSTSHDAAVSLHFDTADQAERAQAAFTAAGHPTVGIAADVTTYCLD